MVGWNRWNGRGGMAVETIRCEGNEVLVPAKETWAKHRGKKKSWNVREGRRVHAPKKMDGSTWKRHVYHLTRILSFFLSFFPTDVDGKRTHVRMHACRRHVGHRTNSQGGNKRVERHVDVPTTCERKRSGARATSDASTRPKRLPTRRTAISANAYHPTRRKPPRIAPATHTCVHVSKPRDTWSRLFSSQPRLPRCRISRRKRE